jgi:hypothetical protein
MGAMQRCVPLRCSCQLPAPRRRRPLLPQLLPPPAAVILSGQGGTTVLDEGELVYLHSDHPEDENSPTKVGLGSNTGPLGHWAGQAAVMCVAVMSAGQQSTSAHAAGIPL